jgi:hypothetical protein
MKHKEKITVSLLIVGSLLAGFFFYQKWRSEFLWGIFFVVIFVVVPIFIVVTMRLWTRCPRCRKYGTIESIASELRKKGIDPDLPPDPSDLEEEETSLDFSMDLYDLFCRYRCRHCKFEWEEKPPPSYRFDSPPPPYEKRRED